MKRDDFPVLKTGVAYFDSACVSLKPKQVIDAMNAYYTEYTACAGRSAHAFGQEVSERCEDSRKNIAGFFHVKPQQIVFTRNTTEGINLVANTFNSGTILASDKEHNSNLVPWLRLKNLKKITHLIIPTTDEGLDFNAYEEALRKNVRLVTIQAASNVDGMSNPIKKIAKIAHEHGAKILVDGAQAAGHHDIDLKSWDVDYFACSGHKMLGPSGTGILYGKNLEELEPFMLGGQTVKETWHDRYEIEDVPHRFEAGLQDYGGIIGLGAAVKYLQSVGLGKIEKHCGQLNIEISELVSSFGLRILGNKDPLKRGSVTSIIPPKMKIHELNLLLSNSKVFTRSGVYCAHSWFNKHNLPGAVRFSTHLYTDETDVEKARLALERVRKLL